ncbi:MAG: hypothetical protein WCJ33_06815, partial [Pseudomonadota bacterium]
LDLMLIAIITLSNQTNLEISKLRAEIKEIKIEKSEVKDVTIAPKTEQNKPATLPSNLSQNSMQQNSIPFSEIPEFNEQNSKEQAYIDLIKQRYETWLVTYYYLQKCNKVTNQDLEIINNSLKKELETSKAESSVINNIIIAANGSYKELYSEIPCDEQHISVSKTSYDYYMKQVTEVRIQKP